MKKNLTKKIIATLLVIPMLIQNVGVSYAFSEQILEESVSVRSRVSKGVPYESFRKAYKDLSWTKTKLNLNEFWKGWNASLPNQVMPDEALASSTVAIAIDPFGDFASYADIAFNTSELPVYSLDIGMEASLLYGIVHTFKFLKNPDDVSCKVQYNVYSNTITYERFKNSKYMYAVNNKGNTKIYNYSVYEGKNNNEGKNSNKVIKNISFSDTKIEVYGIVNGYAHTPYGFIKTSDLTSTKPAAPVAVSSVGLNASSITLKNIRNYQLTATVAPSNASNKNITWTSSNSNVAKVDQNGYVTAVNAGTATITAKSNNGKIATCKFTVSNPTSVAVTSVGLNASSITLKNIRNYQLTATVAPSNASNKNITWTSSNSNVAKVDQNGYVTAVNAGTATITAKSNNGKTATCKFTVSNPTSVAVTSVGLKSSTTIVKGKTEKLTATVSPSNASNKAVTWTSSNSNIAKVDANGNVTAVNAGTATITAKSSNGKTATCKVTVNNPYKTRAVKFTVNVPSSFKQRHYVEILDANNNVLYTSAVKTGSSVYNFTYQLDTSSSSYTRKIRIRTVDNKRYDTTTFKINSSTINKNVTATFTSGTTANSLKAGQIVQK